MQFIIEMPQRIHFSKVKPDNIYTILTSDDMVQNYESVPVIINIFYNETLNHSF